jgi:simple sugar transport system ATP-binding protein
MVDAPLIEVDAISKYFGSVVALKDVSMAVRAGEVMCLLGDNGAGKSTLIKTLSGVHKPDEGEIRLEGRRADFESPRDALDAGIATVYQDLALVPLMSITRNFFMGREPRKGIGPLKVLDFQRANAVAREEMGKIGIDVRDPTQAVGTLSGGERQCVAIARAVYFGAKVLILDEPTSALGVHQASMVLRYIAQARLRGIGVIFITHNVHHAFPVGDAFTLLNRGRTLGTFRKGEVSREEVLGMMAGGRELEALTEELEEFAREDSPGAGATERAYAQSLREEARRLP